MSTLIQLKSRLGLSKDVTREINSLPQISTQPLTDVSRLQMRADHPDICTYVLWDRVEREVVFTVPIPIGFKRKLDEVFEMLISIDRSYLKIADEIKKKPAEIKVLDDEGNELNMECTIEILKKWMRGEVLFNVIARGFEARTFLEVAKSTGVNYIDATAFTNNQQVFINALLGYSCQSCKEQNKEEIAITLTPGKPFIVLPDGTKVEDSVAFDALLNGEMSIVINLPCHMIAEMIIDPIS